MKILTYVLLILLTAIAFSQEKVWVKKNYQQSEEYNSEAIAHTFFLIGDAGEPTLDTVDIVLASLKRKVSAYNGKTTVVFLGDNIYYNGLPEKGNQNRAISEQKLKVQLDAVEGYTGRTFFIPGNHDWHRGKEDGIEYVKRQEEFINGNYKNISFLPKDGCPGPIEVSVNDSLVMVIFDSQWWLHPHDKTIGDSTCGLTSEQDLLDKLDDVLIRNKDKNILVVAHHPLYSNGSHNGHFPMSTHLFPLRDLNKSLWVPLPVLGSVYPSYRKYFGNIQDIPHPHYQRLKHALVKMFDKHGNVVYACGHEHNLQYTNEDGFSHILSGSGSKSTFVRKRRGAKFVSDYKGYVQMDYLHNGDAVIKYWGVSGSSEKLLFSTYVPKKVTAQPLAKTTVKQDSITIIPGEYFKASEVRQFVLGSLYRDIWQLPVKVPVLDLSSEKGGLLPLRKGGGQQTKSLRLKGGDGKEYVFRSIEKFPSKALPESVRQTIAADIVKDQMASAHPYGAFIVPSLAEVAGVYHTNPQLVYVPNSPLLGSYREEFGGMLVLFEERLSNGQAGQEYFGNSDKIKNTLKVVDKLHRDHDNQVDQHQVLRSRLFDNIISDWDRHDDQWKWASFKGKNGYTFQPIPRDRDQAFYSTNGLLPSLANRKWAVRKLQNFDAETRDVKGLNFNGRYFDRSFLTGLGWEDWKKEIKHLQASISQEDIRESFDVAPDSVRNLRPDIEEKLWLRIQGLEQHARVYYEALAKGVDVVGSNKREKVLIEYFSKDSLSVKMWSASKKKGKKKDLIYSRVFYRSETDEVRVYTLGGDDKVKVLGDNHNTIKVRLITGEGEDVIKTDSEKSSFYVYDNKSTEVEATKYKNRLSDDEEVHVYDRKAFKYNSLKPLVTAGYNVDDQIYIGGGFEYTKQGFRASPYKYKHMLLGKVAFATGAFDFVYKSDYRNVFKEWGVFLSADVKYPNYQLNYYGFGNETKRDAENAGKLDLFYRIRLNQINATTGLVRHYEHSKLSVGLNYQYTSLGTFNERFIEDPTSSVLGTLSTDKQYVGVSAIYTVEDVDSKSFPMRGIRFNTEVSVQNSVSNSNQFGTLKPELNLYVSKGAYYPITLAYRFGSSINVGDYEFYQASYIGGTKEVRGFNRNRYAGDVSLYQNIELRLKLRDVKTYLFPGKMGVHTFFDAGKVIDYNQASDVIHHSFGGGLWFNLYSTLTLTGSYAHSVERNSVLVTTKLFF